MKEKLSVLHSAHCAKCGCDQLFDKRGRCMQCEIKFSAEVKADIKVRRLRKRKPRREAIVAGIGPVEQGQLEMGKA